MKKANNVSKNFIPFFANFDRAYYGKIVMTP